MSHAVRVCSIPLALALVLSALEGAAGDVILPGTRGVGHQFVLEESALAKRHSWLIWSKHFANHCQVVVPGRPFTFYKLSTPQLYALPRGTTLPDDQVVDGAWLEAHGARAVAGGVLRKVSAVPESDRTRRILTTIRLGESPKLAAELEEVRFDAADEEVRGPFLAWALAGVSSAAIVLVFVLRLRRRSANESPLPR